MSTAAATRARKIRTAAQSAARTLETYVPSPGEPDHIGRYLAGAVARERETRTPPPKGARPMEPISASAPPVGLPEAAATRAYLIAGVLAEYRREEAKAVELLWSGNAASAAKVCERARPLREYLLREGVGL